MQIRILTTSDAATWNAYLARLPGADIYHTPEYHAAHQANGDGTALCFVVEEGENLLLHPMMQRTIQDYGYGQWMDLESVYGYSGPLFIRPGTDYFLARAWEAYGELCRDTHQVAEFVRFNPLSDNHYCGFGEMRPDRSTVLLTLQKGMALWDGYSPTARNKIRKAERMGLTGMEKGKWWGLDADGPFQCLYRRTMERNGAADYYSFSSTYFEALNRELGDSLRLFGVYNVDGKIIAASLFMLYRDRMHYHLTGSDPEYRNSGAGNLLLHTAACWGIEHGYRHFHLGGGRTSDPDDALLRFKASISSERRPWYTGRRIHNLRAYNDLCADWLKRYPGQDGGGYFLLWRKE